MWPPSRRAALLSTLETEAAMRNLTLAAFDTWLPTARRAVLPSLTAAQDELPPDPEAIVSTQPQWEMALDGLIVYGAGLLYGGALLAAYIGLGGEEPVAEDETDEAKSMRTRARRIVADATGQDVSAIRRLDARIMAVPGVRQLRSQYMSEVRARMVGTPNSVYSELAKRVDKAQAESDPRSALRLTVETFLRPSADDWSIRADEVSRTESAGSQSLATIEAAKMRNAEIGEELEQTWICTLDSRTRKSHWAADGQRVPLGGVFSVGRAELRAPGDPRGPDAEVRNCRCRVGILAVDEDLPSENDRHTERGLGDSTVKNRTGTQADEIQRRADDGNIRAREDPDGIGRVASAADERNTMADEENMYRTFTDQVVAVLGSPTDDRRLLAADIELSFRDFPLPLAWVEQSSGGHYNSFTVGVIESAELRGTEIVASGYLLNSESADKAANEAAHGVSNPSVDLGDTTWMLTDEDGNEITEEQWWDSEGDLKVYETVTAAKLLGATLVAIPAFGETRFALNPEREERNVSIAASITADARYQEPKFPASWFENPNLSGPTDVTVTEDGRIFGHLACFGECHVGIGNSCVMAPRSATAYAHFLTSPPVLLDNGTRQKVGRLTVGGGHADPTLGVRPAAEHYDDVGSCFAMVNVGEDAHGIWFAGALHPAADDVTVTRGISAPLSGDWRMTGGNYELCAALAVNNPGFPILAGATDQDGQQMTLIASLGPKPKHLDDDRPLTAKDVQKLGESLVAGMRAADKRRSEAEAIVASVGQKKRDEALAIIRGREARQLIGGQ